MVGGGCSPCCGCCSPFWNETFLLKIPDDLEQVHVYDACSRLRLLLMWHGSRWCSTLTASQQSALGAPSPAWPRSVWRNGCPCLLSSLACCPACMLPLTCFPCCLLSACMHAGGADQGTAARGFSLGRLAATAGTPPLVNE